MADDLDRRHGDRLQPGEPAERHPGDAAEGVVRVTGRAAGHRVHRAELGVDEGQQDDGDRADRPGDDRRGAGRLRPPAPRPKSHPEPMIEPTEAHIRPISPISRRRLLESLPVSGANLSTLTIGGLSNEDRAWKVASD